MYAYLKRLELQGMKSQRQIKGQTMHRKMCIDAYFSVHNFKQNYD